MVPVHAHILTWYCYEGGSGCVKWTESTDINCSSYKRPGFLIWACYRRPSFFHNFGAISLGIICIMWIMASKQFVESVKSNMHGDETCRISWNKLSMANSHRNGYSINCNPYIFYTNLSASQSVRPGLWDLRCAPPSEYRTMLYATNGSQVLWMRPGQHRLHRKNLINPLPASQPVPKERAQHWKG